MGDGAEGALAGCERKAAKGEIDREARKGGFDRGDGSRADGWEEDSEAGGPGTSGTEAGVAPAGRVGSRDCILIYAYRPRRLWGGHAVHNCTSGEESVADGAGQRKERPREVRRADPRAVSEAIAELELAVCRCARKLWDGGRVAVRNEPSRSQ